MTRHLPVRTLGVRRGRVPAAELRRIAGAVLDAENVAAAVEVELVLADAGAVRDLNRLYRGRDEPTDVLSFADQGSVAPDQPEPAIPFVDAPEAAPSLGEIVICLPVAEAQAQAAGRPLAGAVAHLLVHGLLHLLAYDHEDEADAARMQAREDELLAALGYAGAYSHGH